MAVDLAELEELMRNRGWVLGNDFTSVAVHTRDVKRILTESSAYSLAKATT